MSCLLKLSALISDVYQRHHAIYCSLRRLIEVKQGLLGQLFHRCISSNNILCVTIYLSRNVVPQFNYKTLWIRDLPVGNEESFRKGSMAVTCYPKSDKERVWYLHLRKSVIHMRSSALARRWLVLLLGAANSLVFISYAPLFILLGVKLRAAHAVCSGQRVGEARVVASHVTDRINIFFLFL